MKCGIGIVLAVSTLALGCDGLLDDCKDDFPPGKIAACKCKEEQYHNENHQCCFERGGDCEENGGTPPRQCGIEPPPGAIALELEELLVQSQIDFTVGGIDACEPFVVHFKYFNPMNRTLKSTIDLQAVVPQLNVSAVNGTTTVPPVAVPWSTITSCQNEEHNHPFAGILPDTTTFSDRFSVSIDFLPTTTTGILAIGLNIDFTPGDCS